MNKIERYFEKLKTKDIICWGNGKHYRNITYPFLQKSGLIENLKGFADASDKEKLAQMDSDKTVILIAVTGYEEILGQLKADERLSMFEAVPSIYLEALYEDMLLLSVKKPPLNYRKEDKPVIPKLIHAIWFSGDPMPELYLRCLESWKKYAPDYEIKIWNIETYKPDRCLFFEQAIEHKNWAFASDYARADLLYRYGGIYMDLDVEMLRPIDDLLYNDAYMSFESLDRIECGSGMGSRPGHPIIKEICESYEKRPYLKEDGTWDNSTCPVRYTQVIEKHGLKKDGGFQFVEDITVYPFEVLTGKSFDTGIIYSSDLSYTVHHHNGSWIPDPAHKAMNERYNKIQRFLESLE
ncbi:glycosyltransferase family 32 protein [Butyrivibrio sp. VCB2001]|uniref:glycosyltransferase family 32 protein n=1 Tax=Butyrivibrio sp. VCB2001 TaxID=1280667 RepID=UPI00040271A1|nr:glycosyltransferase [Butyrivibrio sp. VCB2001]